jgi:Sulfotransferase family
VNKVFIVGCPRSGTTMVQQALNRHSQIVIPPETKFFFSFFGQSRGRQARHVERLNADLGIRLPPPAKAVRSVADGRAFFEAMARQYVEKVPKRNPAYFGEKTPEHTGHLPRIRQLFPRAKILVLHRDGRDVALSLSKMPWMTPDLYVNFIVWLYYQRAVRRAGGAAYPHLYFARYEDVVADPEKEFRGVLRFLGLPYEPAVARGCGNTEGIPEREYPWKHRALGGITAERVGVFKSELSHAQIAILERLGRHALPSLGYELLTDGQGPLPPGFLLKVSLALARFACRLPWPSLANEWFGGVPPPSRGESCIAPGPRACVPPCCC